MENSHALLLLTLLLAIINHVSGNSDGFIFNGFNGLTGSNLSLDGSAVITTAGLLQLTNATRQLKGHAFHPTLIQFKNSTSGDALSFSSTFVFGIRAVMDSLSGNGFAFAVSPTTDFSQATGSQFLGLLNDNENSTEHLLFVELDTIMNEEIYDINNNHVGININNITSNKSKPAGYYPNVGRELTILTLASGDPMQVWVEYDGPSMQLNVTIAPFGTPKPTVPLLSSTTNLTAVIKDQMYVGFSSSTGSFPTSHYILGWSFMTKGKAQELNSSGLPNLPPKPIIESRRNFLAIWVSLAVTLITLALLSGTILVVSRRIKFAELVEDWEEEYQNHRFSYRDLYKATKGFKNTAVLGVGGFARVYRGVLPDSKLEVAVKRIPHESTQEMKDFIAEIVSIGQLRHRNLVQQLGYCRRQGELILVYDFMPKGSLDKLLFGNSTTTASLSLPWWQRFHIIKGVASGLRYLHDEWEKVVIHRDIKASNVLLDGDLNARLGDFGLARLYDHGSSPRTTLVVGTIGYIAPELMGTGRPTKATDVFAFGVFLLEVVCGRRPIEAGTEGGRRVMVDWVLENWRKGTMMEVVDPKMRGGGGTGGGFVGEEVELVLKLGMVCSHPLPTSRPCMGQVMEILDGVAPVPEISTGFLDADMVASLLQRKGEGEGYGMSTSVPLLAGAVLSTER